MLVAASACGVFARAVALINDAADALWEHAVFLRGGVMGLPDEVGVHKYWVGRPAFLGDLGK